MGDSPLTESWVLMSTSVLGDIDIGVADIEKLMSRVLHATPEEMELDDDIHDHLDNGGIVIIHCEVDESPAGQAN